MVELKRAVLTARTSRNWSVFLKQWHQNLRKWGDAEARRIMREEQNLIYVKTYTVREHFRVRWPRH